MQAQIPGNIENAINKLCGEITSDRTHTKKNPFDVRVKQSPIAFRLLKTASKFSLSYRVTDEGGWIEFVSITGNIASKTPLIYEEVRAHPKCMHVPRSHAPVYAQVKLLLASGAFEVGDGARRCRGDAVEDAAAMEDEETGAEESISVGGKVFIFVAEGARMCMLDPMAGVKRCAICRTAPS
jgi:hypothetical protein